MRNDDKPILLLDFDGTISDRDAIDAILENFADARWQIVEEQWKKGVIGSRECLREQAALITAAPGEINDLLDAIRLDPGLESLLKVCRRFEIETSIISDGFDYCIERILARSAAARRLPIFSSRLKYQDGAWRTAFPYYAEPCRHGCATCKPAVMKNLNPQNAPMIFVGDGLSDRYAAQTADLVFAKKGLANFCEEKKIKFSSYENLFEVGEQLENLLILRDAARRSAMPWLEFISEQKVFSRT